jgi:hypothetical protein
MRVNFVLGLFTLAAMVRLILLLVLVSTKVVNFAAVAHDIAGLDAFAGRQPHTFEGAAEG